MKVVIGVPYRDLVHATFAQCLAGLVGYSVARGVQVQCVFTDGTLIAPQREDIAQQAIHMGADYIMWIDSDMAFPVDALVHLLAHKADIVATNYCTRREPCYTVAFRGEFSDNVYTEESSTGLEEVDSCGMGFMLTRVDVFKKLDLPWFEINYNRETKATTGEDIFFCRKARAAGYQILIDHDLSKEIGHLGIFEFRHGHANAWRSQIKD